MGKRCTSMIEFTVGSLTKRTSLLGALRHNGISATMRRKIKHNGICKINDIPATWIAFITYWIISLPLGLGLSHWTYLGAYGYWVGFIISLGIAAIAYNTRLWGHTAYIYQQKGDQPND